MMVVVALAFQDELRKEFAHNDFMPCFVSDVALYSKVTKMGDGWLTANFAVLKSSQDNGTPI